MNLAMLQDFLIVCTIINGGLLILWTVLFLVAPKLVYQTQKGWFPLPEEQFRLILYCFLGLFKMLFVIFNLVPLIAVMWIG